MKFGIKILLNTFAEELNATTQRIINSFGGVDMMLAALSKELYSVELASVREDTPPELLLKAFEVCKAHGLEITVHGALPDGSPDDFFVPYEALLKRREAPLNVTVHPHFPKERSVTYLKSICSRIERENLPLRITLENQRYRDKYTADMGCRTVTEIAKEVNSSVLFLCFDFGHQLSNIRNELEPIDLTDDEFFSRVKHTHIHSLFEGKTHFPLSVGETALDYNLKNLFKHGFDGVLMLELGPDRYFDRFDTKTAALDSIGIIKKAAALAKAALLEEENFKTYGKRVAEAYKKLKTAEKGIMAIAPAGYIVKLGDTLIAVDPSVNRLPLSETDKALAIKLVSSCDCAIVTHSHTDHYDKALLADLPEDIPVYIPDFMPDKNKNAVSVTDGTVIEKKGVKITFFDSPHSRGENIVLQYGFALTYKGKSYVFPTDVRDYLKPHPVFKNTGAVVAHLWLGRQNSLKCKGNYTEEFIEFFSSFGAEKYFVGHLLDTIRPIEDMWNDMHFDIIKDGLKNSQMLKTGDFSEL